MKPRFRMLGFLRGAHLVGRSGGVAQPGEWASGGVEAVVQSRGGVFLVLPVRPIERLPMNPPVRLQT